MSILKEEIHDVAGGVKKEFDPEAIPIMMDLVQKFQYQFPIKSTIRELASNAVDAIKERDVAKEILTGRAKVEDYYVVNNSAIAKDSAFNSSYYDLKWLSDDPNVRIIYEERGTEKDVIRIIDPGVGLGGKRLEKYFQLGFSSKRASSWALGKFGIGGKAALSTGEPYYTIKTRYNGQEFEFNVSSYKIESIVPPTDLVSGKPNNPYTFEGGYVAFSRTTTERNGTEIIINTKKFKKQEYLDAVQSQLLYFNNITLFVKHKDGRVEELLVKANILYEDQYLVISDNKQYSKPHIVLDKMNYGYIHFNELAIEDKMGNVGIKVGQAEVTVNPSRESLNWDDLTRATVLARFKEAAKVATRLVTEGLDEKDFLKWLKLYLTLGSKTRQANDPLSNLAGIVDLNSIEPTYKYDTTFKIGDIQLLLPSIKLEKVFLKTETKRDKDDQGNTVTRQVRALKREQIKFIKDLNPSLTFVIVPGESNVKTMKYLASQTGEFYALTYTEPQFRETLIADGQSKDPELKLLKNPTLEQATAILAGRAKRLRKLLEASSIPLFHDRIQVPEDWTLAETDVEIVAEEEARKAGPTLEEQRKLDERIVAFTARSGFSDNRATLEWQKIEPKWSDVLSWNPETTYYGTDEDSELLKLASSISRANASLSESTFLHNPDLFKELGLHHADSYKAQFLISYGPGSYRTIVKVSKELAEKMKTKFKHIGQFFYRVEGDVLTMDLLIPKWNAARYISKYLKNWVFLENYTRIDANKTSLYKSLKEYYNKYYRNYRLATTDTETEKSFRLFLKGLTEIQQAKIDGADEATIKQTIKELSGEEYNNALGIDMDIVNSVNELNEYTEILSPLLNSLPTLISGTFSEELEREIKFYISNKGL